MSSSKSRFTANRFLQQYLLLNPVYVALHGIDANELDPTFAHGYARQLVQLDQGAINAVANADTITFGPALADWDAVLFVGIWDNSDCNHGSILYRFKFSAETIAVTGDTVVFDPGTITIVESFHFGT